MNRLRRIDVKSLAKTMGVIGFATGFPLALVSWSLGTMKAKAGLTDTSATVGVVLLITSPIISGVMGMISGMLSAWVYNVTVGWTGGVRFELDDRDVAPE